MRGDAMLAMLALCAVVQADDTLSNEQYASQRPVLQVMGPNPVRIDVDPNKLYYEDMGAACTDPQEGNINMNVVVSGDFVEIGRPGLYHLMYECSNSKGQAAKPEIRTVVVSENFNPGCTTVIVSGQAKGTINFDRMGAYELQYTRCERGPGDEGLNERPDGRCAQTTIDGSPVFKQLNGGNFMYYYKPMSTWFIDDKFACTSHCSPIGDPHKVHSGFRAQSTAHQPENVMVAWQRASQAGSWLDSTTLTVGCTAPPPLPEGYDYKVSARMKLTGVTMSGFEKHSQLLFKMALGDTLDIAVGSITIDKVSAWHKPALRNGGNQDTEERRRRLTDDPAIDVAFSVTNTRERLARSIEPQLEETLFTTVFTSELRGVAGQSWTAEMERGSVTTPTMTTRAKIKLVALTVGALAAGVLVLSSLYLTHERYQRKQTEVGAELVDTSGNFATTEETQGLTQGESAGGFQSAALADGEPGEE
eukprot:g6959.t1